MSTIKPRDTSTEPLFPVVKKCGTCGAEYTADRWAQLPLAGMQRIEADEDGPASNLEMRNCVCGSTLAIEWVPPL